MQGVVLSPEETHQHLFEAISNESDLSKSLQKGWLLNHGHTRWKGKTRQSPLTWLHELSKSLKAKVEPPKHKVMVTPVNETSNNKVTCISKTNTYVPHGNPLQHKRSSWPQSVEWQLCTDLPVRHRPVSSRWQHTNIMYSLQRLQLSIKQTLSNWH